MHGRAVSGAVMSRPLAGGDGGFREAWACGLRWRVAGGMWCGGW